MSDNLYDYSQIQVIGFDLDQTLYPKSPAVDALIQKYIFQKIADVKQISLTEAEKLFSELYKNGAGLSGSQTVESLGIPNGQEVVQEALEHADIASTLSPNQEAIELLKKLKEKYRNMDVITGSDMKDAKLKLGALHIEEALFNHIITSDSASKSDGGAFREWLKFYQNLEPKNFLYVGDRVRSDFEIPRDLGMNSILVNVTDPLDIPCLQLPSLLSLSSYL